VQWLPPLLWPIEPGSWQTAAHVERRGQRLFEAVCQKDLVGMKARIAPNRQLGISHLQPSIPQPFLKGAGPWPIKRRRCHRYQTVW
jgi:hypothetical protein